MKSRYAIRTITTPAGSTRYEVSGYSEKGQQVRKRFKSQAEADGEIHRLIMADRRVVGALNIIQTRLSHEQVKEAKFCFDLLPGNTTLTDAVKRLVKAWNEGESPAVMRDALAEHLAAMKNRRCTKSTLRGTKSKIKRFLTENEFAEVPIDQITEGDVKTWLESLPIKSFNGYRLALSGLWSFAVVKEWCKTNVVSAIPAKKDKEIRDRRKVEVLSIEQVSAMLRTAAADGKSLAWTAVAVFGGLRPESELPLLSWGDIDLRADFILVNEDGKTGERHVNIHPTLKEWLRLATGQKFDLTRADLKTVKRAAGYSSGLVRKRGGDDWKADRHLNLYPANVTRHTFGSYLYGRELNYNHVADQMGNSPPIVKKHYRRALPSYKVEAFWNLTPDAVLGDKKLEAAV